jgi:nitric oxide reductase large subunit
MEEQNIHEEEQVKHEEEKEVYVPRPAWQVWGARIGAVIVFVAFLLYCWQIAMGGR